MIEASSYFGLAITLIAYFIGVYINKKSKLSLCNPLLISITLVVIILLVFHIPYDIYNHSAEYISYLLTPATISLAIPLYQQVHLLKNNLKAILFGISAGVVSSLSSVLAFSFLFQFLHEEYVTFLPKSITTAIGMGICEELGGYVSIAVAAIIITGVLGNIFAEIILKIFHIKNTIAKGIGIGCASHAVGTSKAMQIGEIEGAMSSLAIVVSGLITVIGASIFSKFM